MLEWLENLYVSDSAAKNVHKTIRRINQKKLTPGIYLLTLPCNDRNTMDIISASMLLQETVRRRCPRIIGIANGKEDAYALMQEIVEETYRETGTFRVKEYLKDR